MLRHFMHVILFSEQPSCWKMQFSENLGLMVPNCFPHVQKHVFRKCPLRLNFFKRPRKLSSAHRAWLVDLRRLLTCFSCFLESLLGFLPTFKSILIFSFTFRISMLQSTWKTLKNDFSKDFGKMYGGAHFLKFQSSFFRRGHFASPWASTFRPSIYRKFLTHVRISDLENHFFQKNYRNPYPWRRPPVTCE